MPPGDRPGADRSPSAPRIDAAWIADRLARADGVGWTAEAEQRAHAALKSAPLERLSDESAVPLKPAAVLIPLIDHADGLSVLLTERSSALRNHAGQISFPGGRIDAHETDPAQAALRETEEEVGLQAERVRILGRLGAFVTGTGYLVTPVVGLITPPLTLRLNEAEVVDAFEVPLSFLLDQSSYDVETAMLRGQERYFYVFRWRERRIWGATASIIVKFANLLRADQDGA